MSAFDGTTTAVASSKTLDIAIDVAATDQLFNAPPINPFSDRAIEILGNSGLSYIIRQLQAHRSDWQRLRLVVRLPPDQITPGSAPRLVEAIRRYCRAKIADNALEIRLMRFRSAIGLGISGTIVATVIAIAYILFTGAFSGASQITQFVVTAAISLFSWVTLWDVLEALIFNPIPLLRENATLARIVDLEIVVEAAPADHDHGSADPRQ